MDLNDLDRKAREQFNAWLLSRGVVITDMHRRLDMFDAWRAALRLAVPDGWAVVPRNPTGDMLDAMIAPWMHAAGSERECLTAGWRDAIAAAPTLADEGDQ